MLVATASKDIKIMLHKINKMAKTKKNLTRTLEHLTEFMEFHSDMKRLVQFNFNQFYLNNICICICVLRLNNTFYEIYQPIIETLFLWSLLSMTGVLVQMELAVQYSLYF